MRLDPGNAATLFALVGEVGMPNTTVVVTGNADNETNPTVLGPETGNTPDQTAVFAVTPETSTDMFTVVEDMADKAANKKRELWPYERRN